MSDIETSLHYRSVYFDTPLVLRYCGRALLFGLALIALAIVIRETVGLPLWLVAAALAIGTLLAPALLPFLRMHNWWRLHADRIEIDEWPGVRGLVPARSAVIPFADIAGVSLTERFNAVGEFVLLAADGRRFRLVPELGGGPNDVDHAGFRIFLNRFQEAVAAAGVPAPTFRHIPPTWASPFVLALLGLATGISVLLLAIGLWQLVEGWDRAIEFTAVAVASIAVFGGPLQAGLRSRRNLRKG